MSRWVLRPPVESWGELFLGSMENKKTYSELLCSPLWQKKRLKIMERDDFTCQHCGCKERELQVHHRIYHKGAKPWEYDDSELITLCNQCHEVETEVKNQHYHYFMYICDLSRKIGLSEIFIEQLFIAVVTSLESICANSYRDLPRYMLFEAFLNSGIDSDLDILCKNDFRLTEEEIDILKEYNKEALDKYSLLKEKYNESDE